MLAFIDSLVSTSSPTIDSGQVRQWQVYVAWAVVIIWLAGFTVGAYIMARRRFDEGQRRQVQAIRPQILEANPVRAYIDRSASVGEIQGRLQQVLDGNPPEQKRLRDAAGAVQAAIGKRLPDLSPMARVALAEVVILVGVLSLVAVATVGFDTGVESGTIIEVGMAVAVLMIGLAAIVVAGLVDALPGSDVLVSIATGGASTTELGVLAFLTAWFLASTAILEHKVPDEVAERTVVPRSWRTVGIIGLSLAVVGGVGTVDPLAGLVVFIALVAFGIVLVFREAAAIAGEVRLESLPDQPADEVLPVPSNAESTDPNPTRYRTATWIHGVDELVSIGSLPLVGLLAIGVIQTGTVAAAAGEVVAGGPFVWVAIVAALVASAILAREVAPEATRDIGRGLQRVFNAVFVRAVGVVDNLPILVVGFAFLIAWAFFQGGIVSRTLGAAVVALVLGILARAVVSGFQRVKHRRDRRETRQAGVAEVIVEGYTVEDADGEPIHIIEVDGRGHAHRDRAALVEDVTNAIRYRHSPDEFGDRLLGEAAGLRLPTLSAEYYDAVTERGDVDLRDVLKTERGDARTRIKASLRRQRAIDTDVLHRELAGEIPEPVLEDVLYELRTNGEIVRQNGAYRLRSRATV